MKIDAVILWVDGNDPVLRERRHKYAPESAFRHSDVAGDTRFANLGEIYWCVRSLNRFAPFLNKIYIVTDGQDPHISDSTIPIEIVDHKVIFSGYEEYLPVFNSTAIETVLWRIPGLSEHFLLLNDDFALLRPVGPEDFFTEEGCPICYADKFSILWARVLRVLKPHKNGHKVVTFKGKMVNAADIAGWKGWYILYLGHTPRALLRSEFENFFSAHPEYILRNIGSRFRSVTDFQNQELHYLLLLKQGRCKVVSTRDVLFYMEPKSKPAYIRRKIASLKAGDYKFCCFNSLDQAGAEDRKLVIDTITGILSE